MVRCIYCSAYETAPSVNSVQFYVSLLRFTILVLFVNMVYVAGILNDYVNASNCTSLLLNV